VNPVHYKIHLEPDLESFTFQGITVIEIIAENPIDKITLNAKDLAFRSCKVKQNEKYLECTLSTDSKKEEVTVSLPSKMENSIELTIEYTGKINDSMEGFYRSKYEREGQARYIAVTQFEERDARRAFPCFDDPLKKATFDIEFVIDEELKGIANTPIIEERTLGNRKKLVRFERTPRMSTYLLFFGVGDFDFIEDSSAKPVVRVATTPGKTQYGNLGLQMGRKALRFNEEYTGIVFPISKCDYIAVPDFAAGAMENFGAITFRENYLLVYPDVTSKFDKANVVSVIAHETAHLWFGDLVTPAEWKHVWLNESIATFLDNTFESYYYPEWSAWNLSIAYHMTRALKRDSLVETMPIELPGNVEARIQEANIEIIYYKGEFILRMLEGYLGETKLKRGLRYYLEKHKFACATSREFWKAIEEATGEPVNQFAESWVYQPGYPVVEARRSGNEVTLTQRVFTSIPVSALGKLGRSWLIPIKILLILENGKTKTINMLLKEKTGCAAIPEGTVALKLNSEQIGFYRVKYEDEMLDKLGQLIKQKMLSEVDSFGLENDLYALVQSGDYSLTYYLDFLGMYFQEEDRFLPLFDISQNLMEAYLVVESCRAQVSGVGRRLFEKVLQKIGYEPNDEEGLQVSTIRGILLWAAFTFGSEEVTKFGATKFEELLAGRKVHADILGSTLRIGAATNEEAMEYLKNKVAAVETAESDKWFILEALGCVRDRRKMSTILDFNLEQVPQMNRNRMINMAARNPMMIDSMWQWFVDNQEKLSQLHPSIFENIISSLVPICGLGKESEVKQFFKEYMKKDEKSKDTIMMTLEKLEVNSRFRRSA
jgi:tricorn protease interacting factor F2/3